MAAVGGGSRRIQPEELVALQGEQSNIRNVCILAHVDHGKTTLSDSLVSSNGIISAKLAGKLRFLDSTQEEQQRGITMKCSAISLLHRKEDRRAITQVGGGKAAEQHGGPPGEDATTQLPMADPIVRDYLINLIDSPGHIDFSSDVSTATRLSDGAIVVVDVLEGVCTQTHAVLRQAWNERMKPCLVLNKLDRLILELRLTPSEAYWHLQQVLERVNAISSSLITNERFRLEETEGFNDEMEKEWLFSPERGNVVFASSLYCWAFGLSTFARIWSRKLGVKRGLLLRHLWGDYVFNWKTLKVHRHTAESTGKPMFVSMILEPIWQLYEVTVLAKDLERTSKMIKRLELDVPPRELNAKDLRGTASAIFRRWLPLAVAVLDMVVEVIPNPITAQQRRIGALWPQLLWEDTEGDNDDYHDGTSLSSHVDFDKFEEVKDAVAHCSVDPTGPMVAFVSKVIPVRLAELAGWRGGDDDDLSPDKDIFLAFARVFSGTVRPDSSVYVLGPKFDPRKPSTASHAQKLSSDISLGLYMMMGTSMYPVPFVPAGNLVAIAGLGEAVVKSATLSSTLACPALRVMTFQAKPIVRVAVEVVRQGDLDALEKGLSKLYQADPAVEISILENGEHVITALGELHLEKCLKDLRDKYALVEVRSSSPLVVFRESVAVVPPAQQPERPVQLTLPPWSEEEGVGSTSAGVCCIETSSKDCRLTIRCVALPEELARLLDSQPNEVRRLLQHRKGGEQNRGQREVSDIRDGAAASRFHQFWERVASLVTKKGQQGGGGVEEEHGPWKSPARGFKSILAFGPRNCGPNLLMKSDTFSLRVILVEGQTECNGGSGPTRAHEGLEGQTEQEMNLENDFSKEGAWRSIENSVTAGFQMATASGPLAEEQMYGLAFIVEEVALLIRDVHPPKGSELDLWLTSRLGSLSGQVMSACKCACRAAFLASPVRLVEALFECDLQCDRMQLGKLYGVLSKRRGRVVEEEIIEGTDLFIIKALLPVAESFGFATELLTKTSGAATSPQLSFSHWERMDLDPFWRPHNEADREEFGESINEVNVARKYIDDTRRRKGLKTGERVVVYAEKQRTLSKKK